MLNALSVVASRAAAFIVAMLIAWLGVRYKFEASPELRDAFTKFLEGIFLAGMAGLATHFGVALKANPDDVASPTKAARGRADKKARKLAREHKRADARREVPYPTPEDSDDLPPRSFR